MRLLDDRKFLVLQGGGALGAYQAGAYEALHKAGIRPEWVAGISIGGINAALIVGSAEEKRVASLRAFWEKVSEGPTSLPADIDLPMRRWINEYSAAYSSATGVPGFYVPRYLLPLQWITDRDTWTSFNDTSPLLATLNSLVDFDLINKGKTRISLGVVDVESGDFDYFDNRPNSKRPEPTLIDARHVAASGALPPGLPPVRIGSRHYWDGGLVSNTPFQWIMDERDTADDICVFQVDLFSARGRMPRDLFDVAAREKEIRYSSRTRLNTDEAHRKVDFRKALRRLLALVPEDRRSEYQQEFDLLSASDNPGGITAVHLIYRRQRHETQSMDNEFSRVSVEEHWKAGYDDVMDTLHCRQWSKRRIPREGFVSIDHLRHAAEP